MIEPLLHPKDLPGHCDWCGEEISPANNRCLTCRNYEAARWIPRPRKLNSLRRAVDR